MAVRQEGGGALSMALVLRKCARLSIPLGPRNFSSCGGNELRPRLFYALYLCVRMLVSSSGVMWWSGGLVSGW